MKFAVISMQFAAKEDCRVAEAPRNDRSLVPTVPCEKADEVIFIANHSSIEAEYFNLLIR